MLIESLFTSAAKYNVLKCLATRKTPVHLRALSELTNTKVRSVQLALKALEDLHIIKKTGENNRVLFFLSPKALSTESLRSFFKQIEYQDISNRASQLTSCEDLLAKIHELRMFNRNFNG